MLNIKSLIAVALMTGIASVSFAGTTTAAPATATPIVTTAVAPTTNVTVASKAEVKHIKKAKATKSIKKATAKPVTATK
jgi:hypothetical protein